jgi:hypothetical protein
MSMVLAILLRINAGKPVAFILWFLIVIVSCVGCACEAIHPRKPPLVQDWVENAG